VRRDPIEGIKSVCHLIGVDPVEISAQALEAEVEAVA
jgi:hypothetical protein